MSDWADACMDSPALHVYKERPPCILNSTLLPILGLQSAAQPAPVALVKAEGTSSTLAPRSKARRW